MNTDYIEDKDDSKKTFAYGTLVRLEDWYVKFLEDTIVNNTVARPEFYREFLDASPYLFLGEIVQMPHHCILAGKNGKVYWGFHTDEFVALTEEET